MAGTIITECPACFTRFKVTPGQLRLAGGKVRCGACLLVFKAGDPPPEKPKVAPYNPNPDVDFGDVNLDLPDSDHDQSSKPAAAKTKPADKAMRAAPQQRDNASRVQERPVTSSKSAATRSPKVAAEPTEAREAKTPTKQPARSKTQGPKTDTPQTQIRQQPKKTTTVQAKSTNESAEKAKPLPATQAASSSTSSIQSPAAQKQAITAPAPKQPRQSVAPKPAPSSNPLLDSLTVESIEFSAPRPPKRPLHTTAWVFASVFAMLLLASQYFWFERHTLAWQEPWHKLYQAACETLQCQLPTRQLVTQIRSRQMLVQDHPDYQEALLIQLVLENAALFNQPWPALELEFTDLKGRTVAHRRFQPMEYLDTKSADPLTMPTGQPSQIQLEIMKPGTRAVSYALSIVKPDPAK